MRQSGAVSVTPTVSCHRSFLVCLIVISLLIKIMWLTLLGVLSGDTLTRFAGEEKFIFCMIGGLRFAGLTTSTRFAGESIPSRNGLVWIRRAGELIDAYKSGLFSGLVSIRRAGDIIPCSFLCKTRFDGDLMSSFRFAAKCASIDSDLC